MSTNPTPTIDLAALQAAVSKEVSGLSKEELQKQLLDLRVREKTTQKKQYNSDSAKKAAAKQRAKVQALKARAQQLGILDDINEQAEVQAQANFEAWKAEQPSDGDEAEA